MKRQTEPELMVDEAQALAYASADFEAPHRQVIDLFRTLFPGRKVEGPVLDLGCGPGDITFRFARAFPQAKMVGVDGAPAMLELARKRLTAEGDLSARMRFIDGILPGAPIPPLAYSAIISNSLLHHLHRPEILWETVRHFGSPGTLVFICDLRRPADVSQAQTLTALYAADEPEVLRRDFFHSLLAAFEPEEVEAQLREAGLAKLQVLAVGDRHLAVHGVLG